MSWGFWMRLVLADNLSSVYLSVLRTQRSMLPNSQNVRHAVRDCNDIKYIWLFYFSSLLSVSPVGWQMSLWYETLFIEWSDLFCLHTIHLLSPPWQFSLGTGFNIVQNAICIYISFFIRPCSLSPLKTLRISGSQFEIGDKDSSCSFFLDFSFPCYPIFVLINQHSAVLHYHNQTLFVFLSCTLLPSIRTVCSTFPNAA